MSDLKTFSPRRDVTSSVGSVFELGSAVCILFIFSRIIQKILGLPTEY